MRWLRVGDRMWFNCDGVRTIFIGNDKTPQGKPMYVLVARMDDVDYAEEIAGYDTFERAEAAAKMVIEFIENGTLPDPTKLSPIDNAPLKVVRRNNEESES